MAALYKGFAFVVCLLLGCIGFSQVNLEGKVVDEISGEPMFGALVGEKGTSNGASCDFDGKFTLKVNKVPVTLEVKYIGYTSQELTVTNSTFLTIKLAPILDNSKAVVITDDRILQKQKQNPLTVESMDQIAIKEAATGSFYESLGALKGVDMTTASLGFRVINTRGFNSTSPVRMLQLIDGVDNQSPGLNFSLGNFLGASDLDLKGVEVVQGASSAFFGPGAFNGVVKMETKNPFITPGLSVSIKAGERQLFEPAFRWAETLKNKDGKDWMAYKINGYYMRAEDWHADNYEPIYNGRHGVNNPGRYDAVNVYGDEYSVYGNYTNNSPWNTLDRGLGTFYRTGYKESDVLDYNTSNLKVGAAVHFRLKPNDGFNSPEVILASNVGTGTTVYQGDNRFRLKNIFFNQNRVEFKKEDDYFLRLYMTKEDSGNSYDPYATALRIQQQARSTEDWTKIYTTYWNQNITPIINGLGYPGLQINPNWNGVDLDSLYLPYDYDSLNSWMNYYHDSLVVWHSRAELYTNNNSNIASVDSIGFYAPGSQAFQDAFNTITSKKNNEGEGGTRFFDQSSLYHFQAQKTFKNVLGLDKIIVGANGRLYTPRSDGTIFSDGNGRRITNREGGMYLGLERHFLEDKMIVTGTVRADKNQNFDLLVSPAASVVYSPKKNHWARVTFSSGLRNPTLTDQYLNLNVGPAILSGNLNGVDSLVTIPSFLAYRSALNRDSLKYFNIDPIRPEQVRSFELGYRATLFEDLYLDVSYYSSIYQHFIGFKIGLDVEFQENSAFPRTVQAYRYSANSTTTVRTQGLSVGLNYYLGDHLTFGGNYSWNELAKTDESDPVIPAFNTPKNKYNFSLTARNYKFNSESKDVFGASINYKWIQGFLFEGSPQFTGFVDSYDLVDAQINYTLDRAHMTFKLGCSNLLNNMQVQTYGGPRIGRLAYFSVLYEFQKR